MGYYNRIQKSTNLYSSANKCVVLIARVQKRLVKINTAARKRKPTSKYGKTAQKAVMRRAVKLSADLNTARQSLIVYASHIKDLLEND